MNLGTIKANINKQLFTVLKSSFYPKSLRFNLSYFFLIHNVQDRLGTYTIVNCHPQKLLIVYFDDM